MDQTRYTLRSGNSSFEIDLQGARLSLILKGKHILVPLTNTRADGKIGSTHPCSPNFGPFGKKFDLPQHGPARSALWELVEKKDTANGGSIAIHYEISGGTYPTNVHITQQFTLQNDVFTLTTIHTNKGLVPCPVVFGEHLYWTAPNGWEDLTINALRCANDIAGDTQKPIPDTNIVSIPGHCTVQLTQTGMHFGRLWAMKHDDGSFDTHYFCFEPLENDEKLFGSPESMIAPGQSRSCSFALSLLQ